MQQLSFKPMRRERQWGRRTRARAVSFLGIGFALVSLGQVLVLFGLKRSGVGFAVAALAMAGLCFVETLTPSAGLASASER